LINSSFNSIQLISRTTLAIKNCTRYPNKWKRGSASFHSSIYFQRASEHLWFLCLLFLSFTGIEFNIELDLDENWYWDIEILIGLSQLSHSPVAGSFIEFSVKLPSSTDHSILHCFYDFHWNAPLFWYLHFWYSIWLLSTDVVHEFYKQHFPTNANRHLYLKDLESFDELVSHLWLSKTSSLRSLKMNSKSYLLKQTSTESNAFSSFL